MMMMGLGAVSLSVSMSMPKSCQRLRCRGGAVYEISVYAAAGGNPNPGISATHDIPIPASGPVG